MNKIEYKSKYNKLLNNLSKLIDEANERIIYERDIFFSDNVNFLSKSFMVMMCTYLESYLKDISIYIISKYNERLENISIPRNIIKWSLEKKKELPDLKEKDLKFENLKININRKDLDSHISGSPYRTINLFKKFGIRLEEFKDFKEKTEKIKHIIIKRNNIVHHNDDASDLTMKDLQENILYLKEYIAEIDKIILNNINIKN